MILLSSSFSELTCYSFHLGHSANYILASPLITPEHIVPEWYFLGLYAILITGFVLRIINNIYFIYSWAGHALT